MKEFRILLASLLLMLCSSSVALAIPTVWTDYIDWENNIYLKAAWLFDGFGYYHDIADSGFNSTWMGGDDEISSFQLDISLYDTDKKSETARIFAPLSGGRYNFNLTFATFETSIDGYIDLMHDGTLNVYIDPKSGDFYADWSRLTVNGDNGDRTPAPVPEPATLMLLGTGLVGIAGVGRKKLFKK